MDANDRAGGRRLDAVAVERALRRMAARPEPPWLHLEAARRLAERLAPMRVEPERVLDWGAGPGGGHDALRQRYPKAEIVAVEPDAVVADTRLAVVRAALVVARPGARSAGPCRRRTGCRARPRAARLGQHGAARRRRSAGAVRALARAARGRWLRRLLLPRPRHPRGAARAVCDARLAGTDARLHRHARPRRHARRRRLRRPGARPGDADAQLGERRSAAGAS